MKKKTRLPRSSKTRTASVSEDKRPPGNRGRPRKTGSTTTDSFYHDDNQKDETAHFSVMPAEDTQKQPDSKSKSSGECFKTSPHVFFHLRFNKIKFHQTSQKKYCHILQRLPYKDPLECPLFLCDVKYILLAVLKQWKGR